MQPAPPAAEVRLDEFGLDQSPRPFGGSGGDTRPFAEVLDRGRTLAPDMAANQLGPGYVGFDARQRLAQPLVDADEGCIVTLPRGKAEQPLQRDGVEGEVNEGLPEALIGYVPGGRPPGSQLPRGHSQRGCGWPDGTRAPGRGRFEVARPSGTSSHDGLVDLHSIDEPRAETA